MTIVSRCSVFLNPSKGTYRITVAINNIYKVFYKICSHPYISITVPNSEKSPNRRKLSPLKLIHFIRLFTVKYFLLDIF